MKLAKGIKVPTSVKAQAALMFDRSKEKAFIRDMAAAIHRNETLARSRGKGKKDAGEAK